MRYITKVDSNCYYVYDTIECRTICSACRYDCEKISYALNLANNPKLEIYRKNSNTVCNSGRYYIDCDGTLWTDCDPNEVDMSGKRKIVSIDNEMIYYKIIPKNQLSDEEFREFLQEQIAEIDKHKWIESEKACRNLSGIVEQEWISKYAAIFREEWEKMHGIRC